MGGRRGRGGGVAVTAHDVLDAMPPGVALDAADVVESLRWCGVPMPDDDPDDDETPEAERKPSAIENRAARLLADLAARGLVTEPEPARYQRAEDAIRARTYRGRVVLDGPLPARRRPTQTRTVAVPATGETWRARFERTGDAGPVPRVMGRDEG